MRIKLKHIFNLLNVITLVVMLVLSSVLYFAIAELNDANQSVLHTQDVINHADVLLANMLSQETAMRGYLATGNTEFLQNYNQTLEYIYNETDDLKITISNNQPQVAKLDVFERLVTQWHRQVDRYISIKNDIISNQDVEDELKELTTSGLGKEKMDKLRSELETIDDQNDAQTILMYMLSMETGVRAYIINREDEYLEPYDYGKQQFDTFIEQNQYPQIRAAAYDWIENVGEKEISLINQTKGFSTEEDLLSEMSIGIDKEIMVQIRKEIENFKEVEENLLTVRNNDLQKHYIGALITILIALLMSVTIAIVHRYLTRKVAAPLVGFANQMEAFDVDNANERISFEKNIVKEIDDLAEGYNTLLDEHNKNLVNREHIDWVKQGQMDINTIFEMNNNMVTSLKELISYLTKRLNGQYGAIYILSNEKEKQKFQFASGYALTKEDVQKNSYEVGEGLLGQAAMDGELMFVNDLPDEYTKISSGLGEVKPGHLMIIPCRYDNKTVAVIEIASISSFSKLMIEYIETSKLSIAIAINNNMNNNKVQMLLEEANSANEKLQVQQEELRMTNEELENQTVSLMNSKSELDAQQESLRMVNEELEENTNLLEEQKKNLEEKNKDLEESQKVIKKRTSELVQSNKYKSEFLANMSHELRTPLNSILILSELLGDSTEIPQKQKEFANTINNSGKDLLQLINDILDLSKIEAGKAEVHKSTMGLIDFKNDIFTLFEQQAIKKKLEFAVNILNKCPDNIETDEMKIKQIVKNLLSNAFKFTESGSVILNIKTVENIMIFEVADTGIGIAKEKLDSIFEAFNQEDGTTSRKFGGTGLGLSISSAYAKLLGGSLSVESIKGTGSKFILSIPINDVEIKTTEDTLKQKSEATEDKISTTKYSIDEDNMSVEDKNDIATEEDYVPDDRKIIDDKDKVILIIDDDPVFVKTIMSIIQNNNFKVLIAETGEKGLYLADYYLPSAIILDIGLPGMDGWEVLERLRGNSKTKDIPVNIVSGREIDSKNTTMEMQFYQKPIDVANIETILNDVSLKWDSTKEVLLFNLSDDIRETIEKSLKDKDINAQPRYASEVNEAMEILTNQYIDILIIDIDVPEYDELELIIDLKQKSKNSDISIIIYTARDISPNDERAMRNKVEDIIIRDGNSSQRLLDEIKLFVHTVKKNRVSAVKKALDEEAFENKIILIVDDDMRNVFALSSILEDKGLSTVIANNGKEAIEVLKAEAQIDLVLMDIMMPIMDGYETMREIRKMNEFRDLPIIALTAKAMKGDSDACISAGANEYMPKPVDRDKLMSLLRAWL